MADARHVPQGPPPAGAKVTTPAVRAVVAGIKDQNAQTRAERKAGKR